MIVLYICMALVIVVVVLVLSRLYIMHCIYYTQKIFLSLCNHCKLIT